MGACSILILTTILFACSTKAGPQRCPRTRECQGEDCPAPTNCIYGLAADYCGRQICAKGPGDVCGTGMFQMYGSCGEGMFCQCGRCIGCSLNTMECFHKTCV